MCVCVCVGVFVGGGGLAGSNGGEGVQSVTSICGCAVSERG